MTDGHQLQRTASPWTVPPDLKPTEARWALWDYAGPAATKPDGSWGRPVEQIGWVRGPA